MLRLERISPRWLCRRGSRCWATTIGAGKSLGSVATKVSSASTPPADEPTTTSRAKDSRSASGICLCSPKSGASVMEDSHVSKPGKNRAMISETTRIAALPLTQPVVAHQLREGPASRGRRVRAVIHGRGRVAEHDDRARGSLGRDTQDLLPLRLLVVVAEPGRAAAKTQESSPDQQPLRDSAFERLGERVFTGEHNGNRQRRI